MKTLPTLVAALVSSHALAQTEQMPSLPSQEYLVGRTMQVKGGGPYAWTKNPDARFISIDKYRTNKGEDVTIAFMVCDPANPAYKKNFYGREHRPFAYFNNTKKVIRIDHDRDGSVDTKLEMEALPRHFYFLDIAPACTRDSSPR